MKFSMMPLWTTANLPLWLRWGWALTSLGSPWVAQRVCPMPRVPGRSAPSWLISRSTWTRPFFLQTRSTPSPHTAIPVES